MNRKKINIIKLFFFGIIAVSLLGACKKEASKKGASKNKQPYADFVCYPHDSNFTVIFVNKSTNANTYLWDFGDGNTSTALSPTHTYVSRGIKSVTLTAYNDYGYSTGYINIDMSSKIELTNNSSYPYSVEIDGVSEGNIAGNTTQTYEVNPGRHSVYVKQQSGYLFYPTKNTYSIVCYAGKTTSQSVLN